MDDDRPGFGDAAVLARLHPRAIEDIHRMNLAEDQRQASIAEIEVDFERGEHRR